MILLSMFLVTRIIKVLQAYVNFLQVSVNFLQVSINFQNYHHIQFCCKNYVADNMGCTEIKLNFVAE